MTLIGDLKPGGTGRWHVSRSWSGHPIEDQCGCTQEPCGFVIIGSDCPEHDGTKSIRQGHPEAGCPGGDR